jgi:hypothetical protein
VTKTCHFSSGVRWGEIVEAAKINAALGSLQRIFDLLVVCCKKK